MKKIFASSFGKLTVSSAKTLTNSSVAYSVIVRYFIENNYMIIHLKI